MRKFILILAAILVVATSFAQPKNVDLGIKDLKELVGKANRAKMNEILKYQATMDSGEEVFQGFNAYEQLQLAYRCRFNKDGVLFFVQFGTPYPFGYYLELTQTYKQKPYYESNPYEGLNTYFKFKWDGREIAIDCLEQTVVVSKPDTR